ncbi:thioredoxin family protein [Candidatus Contubernalis alkaliaceticus]|uniref:thioredoxin family protein n=1 Tax=Candidatus Contubernalis alkaliaceticus TaxID=338645 RepID=UPI001F4C24BC|nr:MTH895/ArsE family thioredoxin-like protein [Candidatus Contubernalis alkalaceticus]UNC92631.1 TM0996/MTH895 family glutaredoxin-like protein [Candidatus Contubernalis alkalaceticus]
MEIKVLGPGCKKCEALQKAVKEAADELQTDISITKITDMEEILDHDVMMTPGLVINGKVKAFGKVYKKDQIKKWIQEEM